MKQNQSTEWINCKTTTHFLENLGDRPLEVQVPGTLNTEEGAASNLDTGGAGNLTPEGCAFQKLQRGAINKEEGAKYNPDPGGAQNVKPGGYAVQKVHTEGYKSRRVFI